MAYLKYVTRALVLAVLFSSLVSCCGKIPRLENITVQNPKSADLATVYIKQLIFLGDSEDYVDFSGTGFGISHSTGKTNVVTAGHLCKDLSDTVSQRIEFMVIDRQGINYEGTVIKISDTKDLCLLSVNGVLPITKIAKLDPLPGDTVYYSGYPLGFYIKGGINYFEGKMAGSSEHNDHLYNIPAASGASGSPIYNGKGKVVGVISAVMIDFHHMTFAVGRQNLIQFLNEVETDQ